MTSIQYFRLDTGYNFISSKKTMSIMRFMLLILSKRKSDEKFRKHNVIKRG